MDNERWAPINEWYAVSTMGRVYSWHGKGRYLSPYVNRGGYLALSFGGKTAAYIHKLVLTAFADPRPEGLVCDHVNGAKTDNRIENLRWVTQRFNVARAIGGEMHHGAKLTDDLVYWIRASKLPTALVASWIGVSRAAVHSVRMGRSWQHLLP